MGSGDVVPSVTLSPKATKRVYETTGTGATAIANAHAADRCRLSTAVHVTRVVPTGNAEPDAGAHVVDTGGVPPDATGVA